MNRLFPVLFVAISVLTACDGGSGFTGTSTPPPPPPGPGPDPVGLDPTNAKQATRVAFGASLQSIGLGDMVGAGGIASSPAGGLQKPQVEQSISGLVVQAAQKIAIGPITEPCLVSGTMTISGELETGLPYTVGDTINIDAASCDDGLDEVVNGRMEITVTAYTGDILFGPTYSLEMSVLLIDFEVATPLDTIVSNGDATVLVDTTGDPLFVMSISGNSLTNQSMASSETITSYLNSQTVDTSVVLAEPYTLAASGTVASSQLPTTISYTTPVTFQGAGAAYPYAGEMLLTGAAGGAVKLVALDEINVRIDIDADGDDVFESSEQTTWSDIAP